MAGFEYYIILRARLKEPHDIINKFDGRCPECNRKLNFDVKAISIYPYDEKSDKLAHAYMHFY